MILTCYILHIADRYIYTWKRRLRSGERWKIICEHYHCDYASLEEHHRKNVSWKAWLFKCLHILNMTSNSLPVKTKPDFYATCLSIVPHTSFCVQCLLLNYHCAKFHIILMTPEPYITHQYFYATWSTFSDWFHTASFTIQLHDQNSTLSLLPKDNFFEILKKENKQTCHASTRVNMYDGCAEIKLQRHEWMNENVKLTNKKIHQKFVFMFICIRSEYSLKNILIFRKNYHTCIIKF